MIVSNSITISRSFIFLLVLSSKPQKFPFYGNQSLNSLLCQSYLLHVIMKLDSAWYIWVCTYKKATTLSLARL